MAETRFCTECNNMLYPKENREERVLIFACRNCNYAERAQQTCVYKHIITHATMDQTTAMVDLSSDPTFPRSKEQCIKCNFQESVFFQSRSKAKDASMKLHFACCNPACGFRWTKVSTEAA